MYDFSRNHQENHKKSASYQQFTTKNVNYKLLTVNYKLLFPGGPSPHNMARPLIGPPTL